MAANLEYSAVATGLDNVSFHSNPKKGNAKDAQITTQLHSFHTLVGRKKRQPTPVFLPRESCGQRSLGAAVHRVAQSRTQLKQLSRHA